MLDPLQFYCWVLCNGMKMRFRMVMIAHPGPGIGFHKRFMWWIIIPPTMVADHFLQKSMVAPDMLQEQLGDSCRVQGGDCGDGVNLLGQAIHHYEDGIVSLGVW